MKLLSLEEAVAGLGRWLDRALAGEQIGIRKGNAIVELCPKVPSEIHPDEEISPREALRRLQSGATLKSDMAALYLNEVHEERLANEGSRGQ